MQSSERASEKRAGRPMAILLAADEAIAANRLAAVLTAGGHTVARAAPHDPDLFSSALGRQAIVFVPSGNLLSAQLANEGEVELESVLSATRAPGVELLVAVLPDAARFDPVVEAIQRHGKPYVVVRTPGLMEEVAQMIDQNPGTLWLPRTGAVNIARADALADAVALALDTEEQGRITPVQSERFDIASLFDAAARSVGRPVRVHAVMPLVYNMVRPVARWLKGGEPPPLAFADRLLVPRADTGTSAALAG